jgi:class 3 adenylate cyclase
MKVGFGSAGVEIIRNNLEKGHKKDVLFMNSQGSTVNCIFLFCDIRQFTDATECLQEEVFVFTNKVAAVVHSICHSYGGMANKNIGDAFLLSWLLDSSEHNSSIDDSALYHFASSPSSGFDEYGGGHKDHLICRDNEADKALLSVVKICCALHHDKYYLESLGESRRKALLKKLSKRKGPVVQVRCLIIAPCLIVQVVRC